SRAFEARTSGLIIAAVIAAGLTSLALVGNYAYFGSSATTLRNGIDWLPRAFGPAIKRHPIPLALACGLGVALCGLASGEMIYGTGYGQVKAALDSGTPLSWNFGL